MKAQDVRRIALSLPEVTEEPHFDSASFRIRGKIFATIPADNKHCHVFVDEFEVHALMADDPKAFEELWWGKKLCGVRVNLRAARTQPVRALVEESWRRKAPKRLLAALEQQTPAK